MSDHLTTALIILLASLPVSLPAAVLVLRWGFRDDGRPPGYRPRHRRPRWPWRRKAAAFVGATEAYADKLAEVRAEVEAESAAEPAHMSLDAVLKEITDEHEIQEARAEVVTERTLAEIHADTVAELDAVWAKVEDAIIADRMATAAALARWERQPGGTSRACGCAVCPPQPVYDRSAAREQALTALFEEVTVAIPVERLRELVGAK